LIFVSAIIRLLNAFITRIHHSIVHSALVLVDSKVLSRG